MKNKTYIYILALITISSPLIGYPLKIEVDNLSGHTERLFNIDANPLWTIGDFKQFVQRETGLCATRMVIAPKYTKKHEIWPRKNSDILKHPTHGYPDLLTVLVYPAKSQITSASTVSTSTAASSKK